MKIQNKFVGFLPAVLVLSCGGRATETGTTATADPTRDAAASDSLPNENPTERDGGTLDDDASDDDVVDNDSSGDDSSGDDSSGDDSSGDDSSDAADPDDDSLDADLDDDLSDDVVDDDFSESTLVPLNGTPTFYRYVRLTHQQWANSVRDNLDLATAPPAFESFTPDLLLTLYSNNEVPLNVGTELFIDYRRAAEGLGNAVAGDSDWLQRIYSESDARGLIEKLGRRFYRRPLTTAEIARYESIFNVGAELPSAPSPFAGGAALTIEIMLQAPNFLYRIERVEDGAPLGPYELATKLAYFVTNSTPSETLLDAAAEGKLDTTAGLAALALDLVQTDAARESMRVFHGETHSFQRYADITRDPSLPYDSSLNGQLAESAYLFFDRIFTMQLGLSEILQSTHVYVSADLSMLYDLSPENDLPFYLIDAGSARPGFFSQPPQLILYGMGLDSLASARGTALGNRLLCTDIPASPSGVTPAPIELQDGQTTREWLTETASSAVCAACHEYFDPLGFAFENFDGLGRERSMDNGQPVDTSAEYNFPLARQTFSGAPELMRILAEELQVHACYSRHLTEFALGRELDRVDEPLISILADLSVQANSGASVQNLMLNLVTSSGFRTRRGN